MGRVTAPGQRSRARGSGRRLAAALAGVLAALAAVALLAGSSSPSASAAGAPGRGSSARANGLGISRGKVKHVWLIILENKSYDATFTGLNHNTYLWRTLPAQGILLKNYYGTGHSSEDNYLSMVSGQATQPDSQSDCPYYDRLAGRIEKSGSLRTNPNYGQFASAAGPNAKVGSNGCVYPASVQTLFNQFDAARVSWKGYAQDLGNPDGGGPPHSQGPRYCGAPFKAPGPTGSNAYPSPQVANSTDQYLPKHFPFAWFESLLRSRKDCNAAHIANLFDPRNGLYHDLQRESRTPTFSWITPDMCSDAHDQVCYGNNLSGGFSSPTRPKAPANYTGGLYAADLFLRHVIPEIEASRAFKDGGLIDITFDEAFPPFTFSGNSFANSTKVPANASTSLATDSAAETLFGRSVHIEPTGPNTPLARGRGGNELYPGPGNNAFIDRPLTCVPQTIPSQPAGTCILGGGGTSPVARTDTGATAPAGSSAISDNAAIVTDAGRSVSGSGIPAGAFVGKVTNTHVNATAPKQSGGFVDTGSFTLVDGAGNPLRTSGAVSGVTLGAVAPHNDPLYNVTGATTGGGDTGSVLISPYIKPHTVSTVYYNHYSWLRTIEDLFGLGRASRGLDGDGHIGYAAQPGLAPFGPDVFNRPNGPRIPSGGRGSADPATAFEAGEATDVGRIEPASAAHPWLAIEGDAVSVTVAGGRTLATVVGPRIPRRGGVPAPPTTRCTFTITLTDTSGEVPLRGGAFTIVDEYGQVHHPRVTVSGGGSPPSTVAPGHTVSLTASAMLPTGNGQLRWAPAGTRPIVSWDFDVEVD